MHRYPPLSPRTFLFFLPVVQVTSWDDPRDSAQASSSGGRPSARSGRRGSQMEDLPVYTDDEEARTYEEVRALRVCGGG